MADQRWIDALRFTSSKRSRVDPGGAAPAGPPAPTSGLSYAEALRQMVAMPIGRGSVTSTLMLLALGIGLADAFVLIPVYANDVLHSPTALGLMDAGIVVGSALHD